MKISSNLDTYISEVNSMQTSPKMNSDTQVKVLKNDEVTLTNRVPTSDDENFEIQGHIGTYMPPE